MEITINCEASFNWSISIDLLFHRINGIKSVVHSSVVLYPFLWRRCASISTVIWFTSIRNTSLGNYTSLCYELPSLFWIATFTSSIRWGLSTRYNILSWHLICLSVFNCESICKSFSTRNSPAWATTTLASNRPYFTWPLCSGVKTGRNIQKWSENLRVFWRSWFQFTTLIPSQVFLLLFHRHSSENVFFSNPVLREYAD